MQARSLSRGSSISGESSPSGAYYSMVPESEVSGSSLQRPSPRLTLAAMRGSSKAGGSARQLRKTGSLSSNNSLEATRQAGVPRQTSGGLSTGEVLIEVHCAGLASSSAACQPGYAFVCSLA